MRRIALACLFALGATAAFATGPFDLDHNGVLWHGSSDANGLLLSASKDGVEQVHSVVPFAIGLSGSNDSNIQVAADDLTGKVAVVWQRNWAPGVSEIMLAEWKDGDWLEVSHLSQDMSANPRNPVIRLTTVSSAVPDLADPSQNTVIQDSFLHVMWWEGTDQAHGIYGLLRLTADTGDPSAYVQRDLDSFVGVGLGCDQQIPADVIEHPTFASQGAGDQAMAFFGSQQSCVFLLLQVHFVIAPPPGGDITQRRRHMPIFGLMGAYPLTTALEMDGTRVVLGTNLLPVAYRVSGQTIEYMTCNSQGWSPVHTLTVTNALTLDQAIPLVENLAQ
jgi:hypothetical protein